MMRLIRIVGISIALILFIGGCTENGFRPTDRTPEPTGETPRPAGETPPPTDETPEPTGKTPEPTDKTPEPVGYHPELVQQVLGTVQFSGSGDEVQMVVANTGSERRTYQIPVSSGDDKIWRLYFSIANVGARVLRPHFSVLEAPAGMRSGDEIAVSTVPVGDSVASRSSDLEGVVAVSEEHSFVDHNFAEFPVIAELYRASSADEDGEASKPTTCTTIAPNNSKGDTTTFNIPGAKTRDRRTSISATARLVREVSGQRVVFWATDNVYEGCKTGCLPADGLLNDSDVTIMADAFLKSGSNNDIYDLTKSIFGDHWGGHDYCAPSRPTFNLFISPDHAKQIDILLYNIGNRSGRFLYSGGLLGYYDLFNSFNSTIHPSASKSNERLMFALHAPWFKLPQSRLDGLSRDKAEQMKIFNEHRQTSIHVLIHEYQHLVNAYQRFVLDGGNPVNGFDSVWLNEQFSMMAQDLVYRHVVAPGTSAFDQRGLSGLGAGEHGICAGRIPSLQSPFTRYGTYGISDWRNRSYSYATNYSFGSYLLRNYGGVKFLRDAYHTPLKDTAALSYALNKHTSGIDMGEAVRRWGVAILLSDQAGAPSTYQVNNGNSGFSSSYGGVAYTLGSINYYNYVSSCSRAGNALRIPRSTAPLDDRMQANDSAIPVVAAENLFGTAQFKVTLYPGQVLTAVGKRIITANGPHIY